MTIRNERSSGEKDLREGRSTPKRLPKGIFRDVLHPALIPGIGVENTPRVFSTNWAVFGIAGMLVGAVVIWASGLRRASARRGQRPWTG